MEKGVARLVAAKVPEELARRVAIYTELFSTLDIVEVAKSEQMSVEDVSAVYFSLGEELDLHWMRDQIIALPRDNRWQALARAALRDDLHSQERLLTRDVLRHESAKPDAGSRIAAWITHNHAAVQRCRQVLADLKGGSKADFAMLSVAMREIRSMRTDDDTAPESESRTVVTKPKPEKAKVEAKAKTKAKAKAKAKGQAA
jgi:glutamate dehydrogenase